MTEPKDKPQHPLRFDNTVTLGNILTAVAMALAGSAAWMNMSERVARTEQQQATLRETDLRHEIELRTMKSENREVLLEIKTDIKELRNELRRK